MDSQAVPSKSNSSRPFVAARAGAGDEIDQLGANFRNLAHRMAGQLGKLKQADVLRRELVANVSHDLKTPLATLQGYVDTLLLKDERLSQRERLSYLQIASRSGERLSKLVANLIELAKLDAMAVGAVVTLPLAGWLVGRFGSRTVTAITSLGFCALLPMPVLSPTVPLLLLSLALFGALNAALDVAMNAQAVEVEKYQGRAIMSSFHGLFSLGGLAGAAATGFAMAVGLNGVQHSLTVAALSVLGVALVLPSLSPSGRRVERGPTFAKPTGILLGLGVMAFFGLLVEGAMADWSAVYLRDTLMTTPALASAGYAAFSLTMAVGRFAGDRLVSFWGPAKLLRGSGMLAASGLAMSLALHHPWAAITGFALVGLGASNVIPILFSAAGRVRGVQTGTALAAVATTGYFGFLAGPPLIGFMAELTNMTLALAALALCCAFIAVRAGILPCQAQPEPAAS